MAKKLLDLTKKEIGQIIAIILAAGLLFWAYGCESKVKALNGSLRSVTRAELAMELDLILAKAELRFADLDQQDRIKKVLFDNAMLYAQSGTINPFGVLTTLAGIIGLGATVDNVRKRKEIKKISSP